MYQLAYPLIIFQMVFCGQVLAQEQKRQDVWELQEVDSKASLRGLCVVDATIVWASGSGGSVLRTIDAGNTWQVIQVPDAEELDFRDIHAFDESSAVIVSAGTPSRIYRTSDGGKTWKMVFEHDDEAAFFDAMEFAGDTGIVFSDPLDGRLEIVTSMNKGESWAKAELDERPTVHEGEAGFAASGSCLQIHENNIWIGLGGKHQGGFARIVSGDSKDWTEHVTPMVSNESSGIFSLAFANADHGVAVGGNYLKPDVASSNVSITDDGGETWRNISGNPPSGYRSAVGFLNRDNTTIAICVGPSGTDISSDFGNDWQPISNEGFHAVEFSSDGTGWATGANGRIGKFVFKIDADRSKSK